ncbi:DUF6766 family protein [Sporocytophaga myxococcoides]|uniref:DUF6766 family protein n=1 Tax=Sporocytophaga myxococcoides TaxID=153721 RepID=UPI0004161E7C|nr:DUF6766 family protein [Sporocytophaga myxococcoides]
MKNENASFIKRNGLSICLFLFFLIFITGQILTGWKEYNEELADLGGEEMGLSSYLLSGHFIQTTFENWESEFLQMGTYVWLTVFLKQKGSAESKSLTKEEEVDRMPVAHSEAPWPVKKGGIWLKWYKNSLTLAFLFLFLISFFLHAVGSHNEYNKEQELLGRPVETFVEYLANNQLWFESFQNWQSEFISVFSIVILSIFLRQKGSPESKPVDAPNSLTGK